MSDIVRLEEPDSQIERDILHAFGWAIVEFEAVLYRKYLLISGIHSLMPEDEFKKHLQNMQAKGYIAPLTFHNRKAWKTLVIEDRIDDALVPRKIEKREKETPSIVKKPEHMVSDTRILADDILKMMSSKIFPGRELDESSRALILKHIRELHRSLADSPDAFFEYIEKNLPNMSEPLRQIFRARGEDVLLLSLQRIDLTI